MGAADFLKKQITSRAKSAAVNKAADAIGRSESSPAPGEPEAARAAAKDTRTQQPPTAEQAMTAQQAPTGAQALKETAANVATDAVEGALQGAAVGGAAGAAAGAVKGAAVGLIKDKRARSLILGIIAAILAITIGGGIASTLAAGFLISSVVAGQDENANRSANESGQDQNAVGDATRAGEKYSLPWQLVLAATTKKKDVDLAAVREQVQQIKPLYRSLTAGAVYQWGERAMKIPESGEGKKLADTVKDGYVSALEAAGFSTSDAEAVYMQARSWALGENPCNGPSGTLAGGSNSTPGPGTEVGGESYTANQISNVKAVIGIAKTMFPNNAEQAATIGLITARVESSFQNYANDGKVSDLENGVSGDQLALYPKLAYSLQLPHDAVGSDHSSVGIMQQQVIGSSWGWVGDSTAETDINAVITRLMTPSFAAARFFESMGKVAGWQSMPAGNVAQEVQVSAFPDRYQAHVALAKALWDTYAKDTPALALPDGITAGAGPDGSAKPATCNAQPGGTLPGGDAKALAQQIMAAADQGKILWWEPAARDQINAYATGQTIAPNCTVDARILQLIVMATTMYDVFSINSLNRACIGDEAGIGQASMHWKGKAVDFGDFNGNQVTGADPESIRFILAFDKVAPRDAGVGQLQCRGGQKITTLREFDDTCHHLHIELGVSDEPLSATKP